jgi:hypothetical protein
MRLPQEWLLRIFLMKWLKVITYSKYIGSFSLICLYVIVNNLRLKLDRAAMGLEDLASKGPLKPQELRGLSDLDDYVKNEDITTINGLKAMPPRVGVREVKDETNYRVGWVLGEEITKTMLDIAMQTK